MTGARGAVRTRTAWCATPRGRPARDRGPSGRGPAHPRLARVDRPSHLDAGRSCFSPILRFSNSPAFLQRVPDQAIGNVVLEDVAHVRHGFVPDPLLGNVLHVVEPDVGVVATPRCLFAKLRDPAWPGVGTSRGAFGPWGLARRPGRPRGATAMRTVRRQQRCTICSSEAVSGVNTATAPGRLHECWNRLRRASFGTTAPVRSAPAERHQGGRSLGRPVRGPGGLLLLVSLDLELLETRAREGHIPH